MTKNNWLIFPKQRGLTKAKLICFPYAGGSAHIFHNWESSLPAGVELVLVQPPGRGHRIIEPLATSMQEWVQSLLPIITPHMSQPYVLFGHSLGSRFAFETMLQCLRLGVRPPLHFIASASRGPQFKSAQTPIWELPDAAFVAEMTKLGGTPDEVLQNEQLMALLTPMLKADFQISDTYQLTGETRISCPLSVFHGKQDKVTQDELDGWKALFDRKAEQCEFDAGHFFINSHRQEVLAQLSRILQNYL